MAQIGSLAVRVSADTRPFERGMKSTRKSTNEFKAKMASVTKAAGAMSAALAAVGVGIAVNLTKKGLESVDAQAKLARQVGATTASIQGLTRAADLSGVSQGKLESSLRSFNKRLGDSAKGMGEAKGTMDDLGLSAEELSKMPLDESLSAVADAVNELDTAAERSSALDRLMSGGRELGVLFEGGSDSIRQAMQDMRDFGVATSEVDAAKIEAANDAMTSIGLVLKGVANQLAEQLSPYLKAAGDWIGKAAKESHGFGSAITAAIDGAISGFGFLADMVHGLRVVVKGLLLVFQGLGTGVLSVISLIHEGWTRISKEIVGQVENLVAVVNKIGVDISTEGLDRLQEGLQGAADQQVALRKRMRESTKQTAQELKDLAGQPMPSTKIDAYLEDVKAKSQEAAEAVVASRQKMGGGGGGTSDENGEEDTSEEDALREQTQRNLEALQERFKSERELKQEQYEIDREQLRLALDQELLTKQEYNQLEKDMEAKHWSEMAGIRSSSLNALTRLTEQSYGRQAGAVASALQDIVTSTATHSKKAFEISKSIAYANAVVKGWEAATSAWAAGMSTGGPYAPLVAASYTAASLAKTAGQISAIKSQSYTGGGGTTASTSGGVATTGGGTVPGTSTPTGGNEGGGGTQTVINLEGGDNATFSGKQVRELIESINDELDGGMVLRTA